MTPLLHGVLFFHQPVCNARRIVKKYLASHQEPKLMNRIYTSLSAFFLMTFAAHAQTFSDDFESYAPGAFLAQSSTTWATWTGPNGGGADDATISSANAHSGTNSLFLSSATGGPDDIVLPFGQVLSTGTFEFNTWFFVTAGKTAYLNYQASTTIGEIWSMDVTFEADGELKFTSGGVPLLETTYTQGQWFELGMMSNLNNSSWDVTIGGISVGSFQNPVFNIAAINFYPIENSSFYVDDVMYNYTPYVTPALNAAVMNLVVENGLATQNRQPTVDVRNLGSTPITSYDLTVDYNGVQSTQNVTGVNYAPGSVTTVDLTASITLIGGTNAATVTVSNVNGNASDDDTTDDIAFTTVTAAVPAPGKVVVAEEATGTWCTWCPRGAVYMDMMNDKYEGFFAGIAVHNNDPMEDATYDAGLAGFISGYPSAIVDRSPELDPSEIETDFLDRIVVAPKVLLTNGATFDATTRELKVSVTADWQVAVNGSQYKLAIVLTEDSVTGTGSGWAQQNSYAGGAQGEMGGFELLPNPVPASMMNYNHVGRTIFPGFDGYAAYATTVNVGDEVTNTATFTLPTGWDENQIHIVGMMIYKNGGATHIDNASHTTIAEAVTNGYQSGTEISVGVVFSDPGAQLSMFPNPSTDYTNVILNLDKAAEVELSMFGVDGKLLQTKNYGMLQGGVHLSVVTGELASGIYFVELKIDGAKQTMKLVKE